MTPVDTIEVCRASHRSLLAGLAPLADDDFRAPSSLPRFTRAHVVTHLANKTRAHVLVFGGPAAGEIRRLHAAGYDAELAASSGTDRSANELRIDLALSFEQLEDAWDELDDGMWDELGEMSAGSRTMTEIVSHHLRDVEVHHLDLDIGYQASDWPTFFVEGELTKRLRAIPTRADHADLLAWLLDRAPAPDLGPW